MIAAPETLDVVVLTNEHGDILADVASGSIGGLGLSPSACYGEHYAYFEPVHGSAPDLAGKGIINPTAMLLSGAMMLDYFGYAEQAMCLERAIEQTYREGTVLTIDQGGHASTMEFVEEIRRHLVSFIQKAEADVVEQGSSQKPAAGSRVLSRRGGKRPSFLERGQGGLTYL
jgi:isocitrate/isopropylmalate dehydrogenase